MEDFVRIAQRVSNSLNHDFTLLCRAFESDIGTWTKAYDAARRTLPRHSSTDEYDISTTTREQRNLPAFCFARLVELLQDDVKGDGARKLLSQEVEAVQWDDEELDNSPAAPYSIEATLLPSKPRGEIYKHSKPIQQAIPTAGAPLLDRRNSEPDQDAEEQTRQLAGTIFRAIDTVTSRVIDDFQFLLTVTLAIWANPIFRLLQWATNRLFSLVFTSIVAYLILTGLIHLVREQFWETLAEIPVIGSSFRPPSTLVFAQSQELATPPQVKMTVGDLTNISNPMPEILDNFVQIQNFSLDMFVVQEILSVTAEDLRESFAVVHASSIPFREDLLSRYSELMISTTNLDDSLREYQNDVYITIYQIKLDLKYTLREIGKYTTSAYPESTPLMPGYIKPLKSFLNIAADSCFINPFPPTLKSAIFCGIAWSSRYFFDYEVACLRSTLSPVPQPEGCWMILVRSNETSTVLKRRRKIFEKIERKSLSFLDNLDENLNFIATTLDRPKKALAELDHHSQQVTKDRKKIMHQINTQRYEAKLVHDELVKDWTSRDWATKVQDWWAGRRGPKPDFRKAARAQIQDEEFLTLESLHNRIGHNIQETQKRINKSRGDIDRARTRVKTIRTSFNNRFCIGDETPDLNQDCGTDAEFAAAIQATLNDITDIQPLLEKIESTGLMAQTVEDALEKQKRKIEADCNDVKEALKTKLDKSHPKDYFLNSQKTREAGQACSVAAWLGT